MTENIKIVMLKRKINIKELAARLGTTGNNMTNKFKRDNFSENELNEIAHALNCKLDIALIDNETGQRIV
ncbi:transcriptional regulator [Lachnospiraceae bacterium]|jgi:DNA-binding Xre family transcriptional regulator|nr:transcriptional regulator [Lachnospiraceae bacterium]